jgi:hypothetical protein
VTSELQTLISAASPLLLGVVAWFIRGMASDFKEMAATLSSLNTVVALQEARIKRVEDDNANLRLRVEDMIGFLQAEGFRKRLKGTHE